MSEALLLAKRSYSTDRLYPGYHDFSENALKRKVAAVKSGFYTLAIRNQIAA